MEDHMATTNLSRRNFAKGAAIAGALASIAAAAVLADDTEADAELLELGRQLAALFEEHAIASEEYDRSFAEFVQPERPATLKATTDKAPRVCS
jgi:secreted PhoX family phosphatase